MEMIPKNVIGILIKGPSAAGPAESLKCKLSECIHAPLKNKLIKRAQ